MGPRLRGGDGQRGDDRLPALEKWLARADLAVAELAGAEAILGHAFGLAPALPVAAITLAADDAPQPGTWLRADPVHLRVGQAGATLHGAEMLDVQPAEAQVLIETLASLFAADGFEFRAPHAQRWYVRVPEAERPRTTPLAQAEGRDVFGLLPRGTGRVNWPAAITEAQMLMSGHAVNEERESHGRPAINSVWFWGEGALPATVRSSYARIYASDPLARGLAVISATPLAGVPRTPSELDAVRADESVLVVLDALAQTHDAETWWRTARELDEAWFAHLDVAIDRFERVRLWIPRGNDTRVATLTASARRRWYRRRRPLSAHG